LLGKLRAQRKQLLDLPPPHMLAPLLGDCSYKVRPSDGILCGSPATKRSVCCESPRCAAHEKLCRCRWATWLELERKKSSRRLETRQVSPMVRNCKLCTTARRACAAHDGVGLCEVATSGGDAKCEDCKSGLITCERHMKRCGEICFSGCAFCLRYKCFSHSEKACCSMVAERVEKMRPIWELERKWEVEERKRAAARALPLTTGRAGHLNNSAQDSHSVFRSNSNETATMSGKDGESQSTSLIQEPSAPKCPKQGETGQHRTLKVAPPGPGPLCV
jgi:hypothetical protein